MANRISQIFRKCYCLGVRVNGKNIKQVAEKTADQPLTIKMMYYP